MESAGQLPPLDHDVLTDPVRRALNSTTADVTAWECHKLHGGYGMASGGVYRIAGSAHDQGATAPWSLVLKIVCPPRPDGSFLAQYFSDDAQTTPAGLTYWKREVEAYQSGLLDDLPACLVAPRCYGVLEPTESETWLWLEHIADHSERQWTLEYNGLVAHHLGCFNGAFLARQPAARGPWLPTNSLKGWVDYAAPGIERLPQVMDHPLVRRLYPPQVAAALMEVWDERQALLDALARLPQTLCHGDAWRRNLMVRPSPAARTQVVAIDWAYVGIGPIGQELVMFVADALDFSEVDVAQARAL